MLAQASIEFIFLLSILSIFLFLVVYQNSSLYSQANYVKTLKDAQEISDQIAFEINLALKAGDGYSRVFYIPNKISNSIDYNVSIENYLVILKWNSSSTQSVIFVKNVNGEIVKGKNFIRNLNGVIYVNQ